MLHPVILCGGAGTRLWPLSNDQTPKQFLRLIGEYSLLQDTVLRLSELREPLGETIVVSNASHLGLLDQQFRELEQQVGSIVLEPAGRNTAPAVAAAALVALRVDPDAKLLVKPADHVIKDLDAFAASVGAASKAAGDGYLTTFGILPRYAETGYGYIKQGRARDGYSAVARFEEKPDLETAERFVADGDFFWNSGMFVLPARKFLQELALFEPDMLANCEAGVSRATSEGNRIFLDPASFVKCRSKSIDYAVMERTDKAAMVILDAGWSDVGSWDAVFEEALGTEDANVVAGRVVELDANGNLLLSDGPMLAVADMSETIVIATKEAVMVLPRGRSQRVKQLADAVKNSTKKQD